MYLVFNKNGNTPRHIHTTQEEARSEAERLARVNRGEEFFILEAIASVKIKEFEWREIRNELATHCENGIAF